MFRPPESPLHAGESPAFFLACPAFGGARGLGKLLVPGDPVQGLTAALPRGLRVPLDLLFPKWNFATGGWPSR
jgi:hypothetical protein